MENTKEPTLGNGKICYVEIPAMDSGRSAAFYNKVFGWHVRKRGTAIPLLTTAYTK